MLCWLDKTSARAAHWHAVTGRVHVHVFAVVS
jgi:hypothetical protein